MWIRGVGSPKMVKVPLVWVCEYINKEAAMLKQFSKFVVGDGRGIRFWKDTWCGTEPLSETFHNICLMVDTKDAYLTDIWEWSTEKGG